MIDPYDTHAITDQIVTLWDWAAKDSGVRVGLVYGGLSTEDRAYRDKCPPEQLSVTALRSSLSALGFAHDVLDPTVPTFLADTLDFDVLLSNLHGPYGENGRL